MKTGIELISEERERQIHKEGFTAASDAMYINNQLVEAATTYLLPEHVKPISLQSSCHMGVFISIKRTVFWPFHTSWFKPSPNNRIKELTKAGALIAAEIDRIQNNKNNEKKV